MKIRLDILCFLLTWIFVGSCKKELAVSDVDFSVRSIKKNGTPSTEFNLGDTVGFTFIGNPDAIMFYSGKVGSRYEYRNRSEADGMPLLSFNTILSNKNDNQPNSLSLLVSDDFKGVVNRTEWSITTRDTIATSANINAATWVDITGRVALPQVNGTSVPSGNIDLSDFSTKNKPVFIAFKYKADSVKTQPSWKITDFILKNVLSDNTVYTIANLQISATPFDNYGIPVYNPGWVFATDKSISPEAAWAYSATKFLEVKGNSTTSAKSAETWAIIGPINLKKVSPDNGVAIKSINNTISDYFIPIANNYTAAGKYKVTFAASGQTPDQSKEMVKELEITIK